MPVSPFVFSTSSLPTRKAKQLCKAFPFLKLATAQEATARALGYASWYACMQNQKEGKPSLPDQQAGLAIRVERYYQQAGVLMGVGIAPSAADLWVRAWGLTGEPTLPPKEATPTYYRWKASVELLEAGKLSAEEIEQEWDEAHYSKYPEIDGPTRICSGVILGPCGKYPHYAVDPALLATVPMYLRGSASLFHLEDDGDLLAMTIPGFPRERVLLAERWGGLNMVQYEWHHGHHHPQSTKPVLPEIEELAMSMPQASIVISKRAMPRADGNFDFGRCAVACLRGRDFAQFIRSKGVIDPSKVTWYSGISHSNLNTHQFWSWLNGMGWEEDIQLPVFAGAENQQPCAPIYSYPFMTAPMASDEYSGSVERMSLLPLDQDYGNPDEDEDDGGELPDDPDNPLLTTWLAKMAELGLA